MKVLREEGEKEELDFLGKEKLLVAIRLRETRVPIPNTKVKPKTADGTMLETAWESRWLPD